MVRLVSKKETVEVAGIAVILDDSYAEDILREEIPQSF